MGYMQKLGNFELGTGACADSGVCGGPGTDPQQILKDGCTCCSGVSSGHCP